MVNANIDIFHMSYEETVSYFKRLEHINDFNCYFFYFPEEYPEQLNQDEIIEMHVVSLL
jgi:hypothetical protein